MSAPPPSVTEVKKSKEKLLKKLKKNAASGARPSLPPLHLSASVVLCLVSIFLTPDVVLCRQRSAKRGELPNQIRALLHSRLVVFFSPLFALFWTLDGWMRTLTHVFISLPFLFYCPLIAVDRVGSTHQTCTSM